MLKRMHALHCRMAKIASMDWTVDVPAGSSLEEAVRGAGMTPDSYIFLVGGRPVPMDTVPDERASVTALRVASGG